MQLMHCVGNYMYGTGPLSKHCAVAGLTCRVPVVQIVELAKESGFEFILLAAGVCCTAAPATKTGSGRYNGKKPYISGMELANAEQCIMVRMLGTGGPLTSILNNPETGSPMLHRGLESMAFTASSAIHAYAAVSGRGLCHSCMQGWWSATLDVVYGVLLLSKRHHCKQQSGAAVVRLRS